MSLDTGRGPVRAPREDYNRQRAMRSRLTRGCATIAVAGAVLALGAVAWAASGKSSVRIQILAQTRISFTAQVSGFLASPADRVYLYEDKRCAKTYRHEHGHLLVKAPPPSTPPRRPFSFKVTSLKSDGDPYLCAYAFNHHTRKTYAHASKRVGVAH